MYGNARDFFFSNRPLECNLDYLKKNDSHTEVNWEGESEFKSNSGIHIFFSQQSKQSGFKQISAVDNDLQQQKSQLKLSPSKGNSHLNVHDIQMSFQNNQDIQQQDQYEGYNQDDVDNNNKIVKEKYSQSPIVDRSQPCEVSTNQASNNIEYNTVQEPKKNENPFENENSGGLQNKEKNIDDSQNPHKNSKHHSNQHIDLKGDYSPASNSQSNPNQSQQSQGDKSPNTPQNKKQNGRKIVSNLKNNGKENDSNPTDREKNEQKPKMFKFKSQLESVHEVECWKDYNRENSRDNKKLGCSCAIF